MATTMSVNQLNDLSTMSMNDLHNYCFLHNRIGCNCQMFTVTNGTVSMPTINTVGNITQEALNRLMTTTMPILSVPKSKLLLLCK